MGNQIVLLTDPSGLSGPFLSKEMTQMCLNVTEWIAQQQAFQQTAVHLAYFCLITGALVGFISGYYYSKRRYGDL